MPIRGVQLRFHYSLIIIVLLILFSSLAYPEQYGSSLSIVPVKTVSIPANRLPIGGTIAAHTSVILSAQNPGRIVNIAG